MPTFGRQVGDTYEDGMPTNELKQLVPYRARIKCGCGRLIAVIDAAKMLHTTTEDGPQLVESLNLAVEAYCRRCSRLHMLDDQLLVAAYTSGERQIKVTTVDSFAAERLSTST